MTTTGPNSSGTVTQVDAGGEEWLTIDNVKTQSDSYASTDALSKSEETDILRLSNFGFAIGADQIIDGITVEIDGYVSNIDVDDLSVYLHKSGSTSGDNKASGTNWGTSDTDTYRSYGGVADTWNSGYDYADINDSGFGVEFRMKNNSTPARTYYGYFDHIRITITHHTIGAEAYSGKGIDRGINRGIL